MYRDQAQGFGGPDLSLGPALDPNRLQRLSADDKSPLTGKELKDKSQRGKWYSKNISYFSEKIKPDSLCDLSDVSKILLIIFAGKVCMHTLYNFFSKAFLDEEKT